MFDLQQTIISRCATLLGSTTFDDPDKTNETGVHLMRWFPLGLVPKRFQADQGRDYPFTVVGLLSGKETMKAGLLRIKIVSGLYINPDTDSDGDTDGADDQVGAATAAMEQMIELYRGLAADCNYMPYSLEEIYWWVGDEDGLHPGPDKFYTSAELVFSQQSAINNY